MNKYGRAGVALLGLVALGGLISLLGGPNVFSTFSSSISTLFPESEAPVAQTEAEKTQDETPVVNQPEEQEIQADAPESQVEEAPLSEPIVSAPTEVEKPVQWIAQETPTQEAKIEKPQSPNPQPVEVPSPVVTQGPSPIPKPRNKPWGPWSSYARRRTSKEEFHRKYHTPAPGTKGTGRWCVTVSGVRELEKNEKDC